ncbi:MAG: IS21 family transposase [Desulfatibacillaceae bacterium]
MTLNVLSGKNRSNVEIAGILGVTEGAVRYQKRKAAQRAREAAARNDEGAGTDAGDERSGPPAATGIDPGPRVGGKPFKAASFAEAIRHWMESQRQDRPPNIRTLHEYLVLEHDYPHTYKSVLRYVRAHYPQPKVRTYRRVETPPGAQTQTDWGEFRGVRIAGEEVDLSTFDMVLSYSRMPAVVWSRRKDQSNWQRCHNEAYTRLGGVAAVNRIDNTKTAVSSGAGSWGVLNLTYNSYAKEVGFHIDACQPRQPQAKGKVEAKVRLSRYLVDPYAREWASIEELQVETDRRIERWAARAICPATGKTVLATWRDELAHLAPVPPLPEPFDVAVTRPVRKDCMVSFENRQYSVPFAYVGRHVEVRGCAGTVQIVCDNKVLVTHPRHTAERVVIDPACYEGDSTDRANPPPPLGRMGARLAEIMAMPVEKRPIDLYAALADVARTEVPQ